MTELQRNRLHELRRTLDDLASPERQLAYKRAVPFVHVPRELLAQWEGRLRNTDDAGWLPPDVVAAMARFDARLESAPWAAVAVARPAQPGALQRSSAALPSADSA